jgi:hypothetical protein
VSNPSRPAGHHMRGNVNGEQGAGIYPVQLVGGISPKPPMREDAFAPSR